MEQQNQPVNFDFFSLNKQIQLTITEIIQREGGYTNDPVDRGGPTNHGITLATLTNWRGRKVSAKDVENLPVNEAQEIYYYQYVKSPLYHLIDEPWLRNFMVDFGVHSGPRTATRVLQRTLNTAGGSNVLPLKPDGIFGKCTIRAIAESTLNHKQLLGAVVDERVLYLATLVRNDPKQARFIRGWIIRTLKFRRR